MQAPRDGMNPAADLNGDHGSRTARLCRATVRLLSIDGAAVVIRSGTSYEQLLCATDQVMARLVDLQFVLGEGPGRDTDIRRNPVAADDLLATSALDRWPGFAREAAAVGARAVFAFPLQVGAEPYGALLLYRRLPGDLTAEQWVQAVLLAEAGSRLVLDDFPNGGSRIQDLFTGADEVAQATGMIAVLRGITPAQALVELRAASFTQGRPMTDLARDVINGRVTFSS